METELETLLRAELERKGDDLSRALTRGAKLLGRLDVVRGAALAALERYGSHRYECGAVDRDTCECGFADMLATFRSDASSVVG